MAEIDPQLTLQQYLYVPYRADEKPLDLGKALALYLAGHHRTSFTVVCITQQNARFAGGLERATLVTERSGSVREGGVVLAWCPTYKAMDKITHLTKSVIVAVEWPTNPLAGWAKLVGAYNVVTGKNMSTGLSEQGRSTLDDIISDGYNGWDRPHMRQATSTRLAELADAGEYDREVILAEARRVKGSRSVDQLEKLLDAFDQTQASGAS